MERHKISQLLINSTESKFVTRKWTEVNDLSGGHCSVDKNVKFNTLMLKSDLCGYSDANIVGKGSITIRSTNANHKKK